MGARKRPASALGLKEGQKKGKGQTATPPEREALVPDGEEAEQRDDENLEGLENENNSEEAEQEMEFCARTRISRRKRKLKKRRR